MITPLPENRVAGAQAALDVEDAPEVLNAGAVLSMDGSRVLEYRGRVYTVPPVPYPAGMQLQRILRDFERLAKDPGAPETVTLDLMRETVALFGTLIYRPWLVRWLPNPFRNASEGDVGSLLAFFFAARTRTSVGTSPSRARNSDRRTS